MPPQEDPTEGAETLPSLSSVECRDVHLYYDLPYTDNWRRNTRGLVNESYEINGRYFLTIYRKRIHDEVEAVAAIANQIGDIVPIAQPKLGASGYALHMERGSALLCPKLPGRHYVGTAHTEKYPIPEKLHRSFATFFWQLQRQLSSISPQLKRRLSSAPTIKIGDIPEKLPDSTRPLIRHAPKDDIPDFRYPDLIHDDMERQNILSVRTKITGIVDLDSIHTGDIFHEFAHFLFNIALCDPDARKATIDIYINELIQAGCIVSKDIPLLHAYVYRFAISDVIDFEGLTLRPQYGQHTMIDLPLLVEQYDRALALSSDFFRHGF